MGVLLFDTKKEDEAESEIVGSPFQRQPKCFKIFLIDLD